MQLRPANRKKAFYVWQKETMVEFNTSEPKKVESRLVNKAMAKRKPFERDRVNYEEWFEKNLFAFESELQAVRYLLPGM